MFGDFPVIFLLLSLTLWWGTLEVENFSFRKQLISLVVNTCEKLLLQVLQVRPTGTPGDHSDWPLCSRRDHQQSRWYLSHCVPGRDIPLPRTQIKKITQNTGHGTQIENHQSVDEWVLGKLPDCSSYLSNIFPEFQIPYLHFFLLIKKAGLKGNGRWSFRVHNSPSSQISSHLNKLHIKIQSLSLLIGSGSDRRHRSQLFWFQKEKLTCCEGGNRLSRERKQHKQRSGWKKKYGTFEWNTKCVLCGWSLESEAGRGTNLGILVLTSLHFSLK